MIMAIITTIIMIIITITIKGNNKNDDYNNYQNMIIIRLFWNGHDAYYT